MSTYQLKNKILFKDNIMSSCPIAPPIIKPIMPKFAGGQPVISLERFGCSLHCPHFVLNGKQAELKCVNPSNKFEVDITENEQKTNLRIN